MQDNKSNKGFLPSWE